MNDSINKRVLEGIFIRQEIQYMYIIIKNTPISDIEKVLGEKSSGVTHLEDTLANRSTSWFWNLGMELGSIPLFDNFEDVR